MNLITLQALQNGTVARNLLSYGTNDGALSALYQSMRASIADTNIANVTCILMTDEGHIQKCERWAREVTPEPATASEEE